MDAFQFFANRTLPYPTCHAESIYIRPLDSYEMTTNRKSWKYHHITVWTISFLTFAIRIHKYNYDQAYHLGDCRKRFF